MTWLFKEPTGGFQLFTISKKLPGEEDINYNLQRLDEEEDKFDKCFSIFEFDRIDLVEDFSVNYVLQVQRQILGYIFAKQTLNKMKSLSISCKNYPK